MSCPETKLFVEAKIGKRILIVTNDSTVFLVKNRLATAFDIFGGRVTEVNHHEVRVRPRQLPDRRLSGRDV